MNALDPTLAMATRGRDPSLVSMGVVLCGEVDPAAISAAAGEDAGGIQFYAVAIAEELKPRIQEMADRLGGRLRVIHFPVNQIAADFVHLAAYHRCLAVPEFLVGYLVLHLCEVLPEKSICLVLDAEVSQQVWSTAARIAKRHGKLLTTNTSLAADSIGRCKRFAEVDAQVAQVG